MKRITLFLTMLLLLVLSACGAEEELPFTEAEAEDVMEQYRAYAAENDFIINKIEPKEADFKTINVYLKEEVYNLLDDSNKQIILDDIGNTTENYTRATLYQTPSSKFLNVYFVNDKQEQLAKTGHFDRGWTVK